MKRRTKIISAVMALAILVCVFAVLATSFAVDTSSESASFRVDAQIMGYNRVEVKIYAPAGAAGGANWWKTWLFSDSFHPTPRGHELMADVVRKLL